MPVYDAYLLPIVEDCPAPPDPRQITSPLDEEIWLTSHIGSPFCWEQIARRVKSVYGVEWIHRDDGIDISHCERPQYNQAGTYRYFTCSGQLNGFAMQHPLQLADYDRLGEAGQRPLLIKPSLFARLVSLLLADGAVLTQTESGNHDSTLAFRNELWELIRPQPSDWHLEPRKSGYVMRLRCNGQLGPVVAVSRNKGTWYVNSLRQACGINGSAENRPVDGSFKLTDISGDEVSLRVSMIPCIHGLSIAVRFLYEQEQSLDTLSSLGMNSQQQATVMENGSGHEGMLLVCGPTGSGKTTTLHALLRMSVAQNKKVLSVEDPVERIVPGVQQVQVESGDGSGFAIALKAFMRQAPDTILIGEIRDPETAKTAIQSAFSGHRILATLHASHTQGVYCRLADFGLQRDTLQQVLSLIIHQRLLPLLCRQCKRAAPPSRDLLELIQSEMGVRLKSLYSASGCMHCHGGYIRRTALFQIDQTVGNKESIGAFQKRSIDLLCQGEVDLKTTIPYQNLALRNAFSFHSCKDFANYSVRPTPG